MDRVTRIVFRLYTCSSSNKSLTVAFASSYFALVFVELLIWGPEPELWWTTVWDRSAFGSKPNRVQSTWSCCPSSSAILNQELTCHGSRILGESMKWNVWGIQLKTAIDNSKHTYSQLKLISASRIDHNIYLYISTQTIALSVHQSRVAQNNQRPRAYLFADSIKADNRENSVAGQISSEVKPGQAGFNTCLPILLHCPLPIHFRCIKTSHSREAPSV